MVVPVCVADGWVLAGAILDQHVVFCIDLSGIRADNTSLQPICHNVESFVKLVGPRQF
jgi:hypothetical protein